MNNHIGLKSLQNKGFQTTSAHQMINNKPKVKELLKLFKYLKNF